MSKRLTTFALTTIALLLCAPAFAQIFMGAFSNTAASACPGDFDGNGSVDIADFLAFVDVFGKSSSDAGFDMRMDLDSNGSVNIADFLAFVDVFGSTCNDRVEVDPGNADALSSVIILPNGTETRQGRPPQPSNTATAPTISSGISRLTSSNGSTVQFPFSYTTAANISGCYLYIDGAGSYFFLPYTAQSSTSGTLSIPVELPTNVSAGQFCAIVCILDARGEISNIIEVCVDVLELGSGTLQISLSWDNTADVDLWVTDPSDTTIYYYNRSSRTGGSLDRDDRNGYGPENIFWENAPDGFYYVVVDHFSGATPARYIVTINWLGTSRQFTGTLSQYGQRDLVTTIRKSGNSINF